MHIINLGFEQFDISISDIKAIVQLMHNLIIVITCNDPAAEITDGRTDLEHDHEQQTGHGKHYPDDHIHPLKSWIASLIDGADIVL
jgi:hypothetical protein